MRRLVGVILLVPIGMGYLKFVKCAHEGTRRIKAEMLGMELPAPEFRQDEIGNAIVRVTLRNNIKQRKVWVDSDVVKILGAQVAHSLKEDEKRCINFCAEYGEIGVSDAQRLTGKSWPAAKSMLTRLEEKGILVHIIRKELQRDPQARFRLRALEGQEKPTT
jgi:ATP-dependent DNA helicase RecG